MAHLLIREASSVDIPSIVKVDLASVSKEETKGFAAAETGTFQSVEKLTEAWDSENRLKDGFEVLVADKKGEILGFAVYKFMQDHVYIDVIDVAKPEQRKGVGKALIEYLENVAAAHGCREAKTDTTENAQGIPWKSYGFWIKMGYKDTGERLATNWSFKTIPFVKSLSDRKPL